MREAILEGDKLGEEFASERERGSARRSADADTVDASS
jgi:hypothetical protein